MKLAGVYVPVITPFGPDGRLLEDKLRANIQKLNQTDVAGYMPLGSNGESALLSDEEAFVVARVVCEEAAPEKQVFLGAGRESAFATIALIERFAPLGAAGVFVLTPHFFPKLMGGEALTVYYTAVAEKSPLPVMLYNAPGYAGGVELTPATVADLATHPGVFGMKDSSPKPATHYLPAVPQGAGFALLAGTLGKFVESLREGAVGGVLSSANYVPQACCKVYALAAEGRWQQAAELHGLLKNMAALTAPLGVPGVKAAMNVFGYACGLPRNPLAPANENELRDGLLAAAQAINQYIAGV